MRTKSEKEPTYLGFERGEIKWLKEFKDKYSEDILDIFVGQHEDLQPYIILNVGDWVEYKPLVKEVEETFPHCTVDTEDEVGHNYFPDEIDQVYKEWNNEMTTKSISEKLNNCPFCGSKNVYLQTGKNEKGQSLFDTVICEYCGAQGPMYDGHPEDAVDGWNIKSKKVRWEDHPLHDYLNSGFEDKKKGDRIETCKGNGEIVELRHSYESPDMLQGFMVQFDDKRKGKQFISIRDCLVDQMENETGRKGVDKALDTKSISNKLSKLVTRTYQIKFDEPSPDWLNPYSYQMLLEECLNTAVDVLELTDKEQYSKEWGMDLTNTGNKGDLPGTYIGVEQFTKKSNKNMEYLTFDYLRNVTKDMNKRAEKEIQKIVHMGMCNEFIEAHDVDGNDLIRIEIKGNKDIKSYLEMGILKLLKKKNISKQSGKYEIVNDEAEDRERAESGPTKEQQEAMMKDLAKLSTKSITRCLKRL